MIVIGYENFLQFAVFFVQNFCIKMVLYMFIIIIGDVLFCIIIALSPSCFWPQAIESSLVWM